MKKWKVTVFESLRYATDYSVEAETVAEAERKVLAGEGKIEHQELTDNEPSLREIAWTEETT